MGRIFIDCDGVLAEFDEHATNVLGMHPRLFEEKYGSDTFWGSLERNDPDFFINLKPRHDAFELWDAVKHLEPIVLTGAPLSFIDSWWQKPIWVHDHFGTFTKVAVCQSKNKALFCKEGDVIIDDYPKHRKTWETAGGQWVLHTSAEDSIEQLKNLGYI